MVRIDIPWRFRSRILWLIGFALLASAAAPAQSNPPSSSKVLPVDQAKRDPSFAAFRDRLKQIVKERNTAGLRAVLDANISISFGGENGAAAFRKQWQLDKAPEQSPVWQTLESVLALGGAWTQNSHGVLATFCAPYVYTQMPEDDSDSPALAAILGPNVPLRSAPKDNGGVIRRMSYSRVRLVEGEGEARWRKVQTLDRIEGFVLASEVRSAGDYRACFDQRIGAWKMTFLVNGD
ncbi:MAG: SH3 domain-containing protein [Bryobacteraceae bacterium]